MGVYAPASHTTFLSSFVPASPARSHHGFSDSQRGVSDEPESSPGHDLLPALPSAHLLLPVSLPASVKPLSVGGGGSCIQSPSCPSPCQAATGHQENCGRTQGSTFIEWGTWAGGRPHFLWEQKSAWSVGWEGKEHVCLAAERRAG